MKKSAQQLETPQRDYDLTSWYLNLRRVAELLGDSFPLYAGCISDDPAINARQLSQVKNALVAWLRQANPPTLDQLLISGSLREPQIFTHYSNFYCKGLSFRKRRWTIAFIYSELDDLSTGSQLRIEYDPSHLTASSAFHALSGQQVLFGPGEGP